MGVVSMASALSNGQYVPFTGTPGVKVVGSHSLETPARGHQAEPTWSPLNISHF